VDAQATVLHVLRETLALCHPVIPFVTEDIWSERWDGLLAASAMPAVDEELVDEGAERTLAAAIEAIRTLRNWRESVQVKPKIVVRGTLEGDWAETAPLIGRMARFEWTSNGEEPAASIPVPGGVVNCFPTEGLDLGAAERKRDAERERLQGEIKRAEGKLANEKFVAKAPPHLVEEERAKLERLRAEYEAL
jgi:valyl-tRNA synthetase